MNSSGNNASSKVDENIWDMRVRVGYLDNWSHLYSVGDARFMKWTTRNLIFERLQAITFGLVEPKNVTVDAGGIRIPRATLLGGENSGYELDDINFFGRIRLRKFPTFERINVAAIEKVNKALESYVGNYTPTSSIDDPIGGDRICRIDLEGVWHNSFSLPLYMNDDLLRLAVFTRDKSRMENVQVRVFVEWKKEHCSETEPAIPVEEMQAV